MPSTTIDTAHLKSPEVVMTSRTLRWSAVIRHRLSAIIGLTVMVLGVPGSALTQALNSVALQPPAVAGGQVATGRVVMSGAAPSGGLAVPLSSNNPVVTVPAAVAVLEGESSGSFTVITFAVAQSTIVTITAAFRGVSKTARLNVLGPQPSVVALSQSAVLGGGSLTATVTLSSPAPAGGLVVQLSTSKPAVVQVQASDTVAVGATTASLTVTTVPVTQSTVVAITATVGSESKTAQLNVVAPQPSSVTLEPPIVFGGTTSTGHVSLNSPAPAGGLGVQLSTNHPAVAQVQVQAVKVKAGATTASFIVNTSPVVGDRVVTITATGGSGSRTAQLTVGSFSFTLAPSTITTHENFGIITSTNSTATVSLLGHAPPGGQLVQLSSSNPPVVGVPAFVIVPAGMTTASFGVALGPNPVFQGTVTLTATVSGVSKTAQLAVNRI